MVPIDLHMHSLHSDDGEFTPEQLVERASGLGVRCMALTDHNSARGVDAALRRGRALGVEVLPGIEIDCHLDGLNLHLLGYFIDSRRLEFADLEADIYAQETRAFHLKTAALRRLGLEVDEGALLEEARGRIIGAEQIIAQVLARPDASANPMLHPYLPGGASEDMPLVRFWWDYFAQGKPAHVPLRYMSLQKAVDLVNSSGGVAVLAHPGAYAAEGSGWLDAVASEGVQGLEVYSTYHDEAQRAHYLEEARRLDLVATCGSDFHGRIKPAIEIGAHGAQLDGEALLQDLRARRNRP